MNDFFVNPLALEVSAAELRTESARIGAVLSGLEQEINRLQANWDGSAQQAYHQAQQAWSRTFAEMNEVLAQISRAVDSMSSDYVDSDRGASKRFRI